MQPILQITSANLFDQFGRIAPSVALLSLAPLILLVIVRRKRCSPGHSAIAIEGLCSLFLACVVLLWMSGPKLIVLTPMGLILRILGAVWLAGSALSLTVQGVGLIRLWALLRAAPLFFHKGEVIYDLPQSLKSHGALVFGNRIFMDPTILEEPGSRLSQLILAHEKVHVRHLHWIRSIAGHFLCAIFWWVFPLRWSIDGLRGEYEATADTVAGKANPVAYVESLLWLARRADGSKRPTALALAMRVTNKARWNRLLGLSRQENYPSKVTLFFASTGTAAVLVFATTWTVAQLSKPTIFSLPGDQPQAVRLTVSNGGNSPNLLRTTSSRPPQSVRVIHR